ncbi:acyltransferase family protein [Lachnospiraceae bacterium YH-ros2228]
MDTKLKIEGVNFTRTICALGIIFYHFFRASASQYPLFTTYANGTWGEVNVTIFFMLSGYLLYYNHSSVNKLSAFYKKRWISIFPAFYIAYIFLYIERIFQTGRIFWSGPTWKLLFSVIGIDGFIFYRQPDDYYLIGDWFLGAIIILYALYPLIISILNKNAVLSTFVVLILYFILLLNQHNITNKASHTITSSLLSFYIGILLCKYCRKLIDRPLSVIAMALISATCYFVPQRILDENIHYHVFAIALFIVFLWIGSSLDKCKPIRSLFTFTGGLTYEVFLLQHVVILKLLQVKNPASARKSICLCLMVTIVIFFYAWCLSSVSNVVKSKMKSY